MMCSGQLGVLVRAAEARRVRDRGAERLARLLWQRAQQRRLEEARRDRADADRGAREVARGRQRHGDDAALGRRVGDLADLAVERRDRRGVDDHSALAALVELVLLHPRGGVAHHVERADQVDLDHALERVEVVGPVLVHGALGPADARAADGDPQVAGLAGGGHGGLHLVGVGDVAELEARPPAELLGERVALLLVEVGDGHVRAPGVQEAGGGGAETRGPAGDQRAGSFDSHGAQPYP